MTGAGFAERELWRVAGLLADVDEQACLVEMM